MSSVKRIVLTGVAGFIGSNLAVRLLAEGHHVIGIDNLAYGIREQVPHGVDFKCVDIRSRDIYPLLDGADAVFHLAAKNCIADCQDDPLQTADVNVLGSVNVFEACRLGRVGRVIYAESSALYEGVEIMPTAEAIVAPRSFYGVSKFAGMAFAQAYERFYGLRTTALRYFCVFGPRQDYRRSIPPVMSAFIIALLQEKAPTIFGSGEKRRDFVYVDDVNDFHMQCLSDDRTIGHVYNLGSGMNNSVNEIYEMIAELMKSAIRPNHAPDMPGEAEETLADISAAMSVGWSPKVNLRRGLERSLAYIKDEVAAGRIVLPRS